jgi:uncharacterized protein
MSVISDAILREGSDSKGRYVYRAEGTEAEMTFSKAGASLLIIDHTGVPEAFRVQGVETALLARAVEEARAAGKKILPLCPFAAARFRRHPSGRTC